jgi:protein phosphatase
VSRATAIVLTSRGLERPTNQDSVGVLGWVAPAETGPPTTLSARSDGPAVVAIADGLGGHRAGEVASRLAVEELMAAAADLVSAEAVAGTYRRIHARLLDAAAQRPEWSGMATTLATVVVVNGTAIVGHVGDSRVYYAEPGLIEQLTTDDLAPGSSGALLQVLGGHPESRMDPHVTTVALEPGARFLLCSDGLHGSVVEPRLRALLADRDPVAAVDGLAVAAVAAGGPDNISICLLLPDGGGTVPEDLP